MMKMMDLLLLNDQREITLTFTFSNCSGVIYLNRWDSWENTKVNLDVFCLWPLKTCKNSFNHDATLTVDKPVVVKVVVVVVLVVVEVIAVVAAKKKKKK